MYQSGLGVDSDLNQAKTWYEKASERNEIAQFKLGEMYELGSGVNQDSGIANSWYQKACDNHLKEACDKLGTSTDVDEDDEGNETNPTEETESKSSE
ncbi:hypothetical protein GKC56_01595 [Neisseriaceae bacterium PsAf]|nr:hypothetical protein [Neisseriaceae bacterium PsAf]MCV2503378.1 sel1 repeat family protein [Neisseriaceae bacterium]